MIRLISKSGLGSFLTVLKTFGNVAARGLLSFPLPGVTLALDFPNNIEVTEKLFPELDRVVRDCGGRLYPAKDDRMRAEDFRTFYPNWEVLKSFQDPLISSSFWRRVTLE
jgi:FAD/FMN-containing dehydrogenase